MSYITVKGAYAAIEDNNFMRPTAPSSTTLMLWRNLVTLFNGNSCVIFNLENEPWGIDASVVASFMVSPGRCTSSDNAAAFIGFTDPANNFATATDTSDVCVSSTIGAERIADATTWLKNNNLKGFLGEIGAGSNDACISAVKGALTAMQAADSPWIGALWWAAGPWWGDYLQSMYRTPSGAAMPRILPEAIGSGSLSLA